MDAIPKFDIKSVIKSDISIKPTTWIGNKSVEGGDLPSDPLVPTALAVCVEERRPD